MDLIPIALGDLITAPLNYWLGVLVDAAVAGGLVVHAGRVTRGAWVSDGGVLLLGLGAYGLLEYVVHRWVYHHERSPAAPGHRWHHDDPAALIAVPFFVPALLLAALWGLFRRLVGDEGGSWLVGALALGFLYYEVLHHALHHAGLPARGFRALRGHHRIHHRFPDCNFGVTTTIWDRVFRTHYLVKKARAPRRRKGLPAGGAPDASRP